LTKAEIGDALRLLAKQGRLNLVIGPEVQAVVSVALKDVPVRQALRALAEGNGFRVIETDGILTVTRPPTQRPEEPPPPLVTRVLQPRSVSAPMLRDALQPVLSKWGKFTVLSQDSLPGYGLGASGISMGGMGTGGVGGGRIMGPQRASATRSDLIVNAIGAAPAASPAPNGNGPPVANSQVLLVTDTAERVEIVSALVEELDVPPRQVLIEARLVEMSVDLQKRLGIDWNIEAFANGPILNHESPLFWRAGFANGAAGPLINGSRSATGGGLSLGAVDFSRFTALLQATQDDSAVRLLANPRMLVFNNHSAGILVGEQYPLLTSTITDQGTATESLGGYIPVGVQLSVTPTIMSDGRVSLLVHPSTSALGDDVVGTTGLRIARIQTREIDTRVVIRDGETIVLGGLISDRKSNVVRKVPGAGDVPILEIFTRQERPRHERVDLLVFLTVYVEGATRMSEDDREALERYKPRFRHSDAMKDVPLHFEFPFTQFYDKEAQPDDPEAGVPAERTGASPGGASPRSPDVPPARPVQRADQGGAADGGPVDAPAADFVGPMPINLPVYSRKTPIRQHSVEVREGTHAEATGAPSGTRSVDAPATAVVPPVTPDDCPAIDPVYWPPPSAQEFEP